MSSVQMFAFGWVSGIVTALAVLVAVALKVKGK